MCTCACACMCVCSSNAVAFQIEFCSPGKTPKWSFPLHCCMVLSYWPCANNSTLVSPANYAFSFLKIRKICLARETNTAKFLLFSRRAERLGTGGVQWRCGQHCNHVLLALSWYGGVATATDPRTGGPSHPVCSCLPLSTVLQLCRHMGL